jgi:uncharacterized protein YbjT (DUF2867 family)
MKSIALVGATGYLGQYLAKRLNSRGINPIILTRRWNSSLSEQIRTNCIFNVDFTKPDSLKEKFIGVEVLISTLGITRQKDNLSYMDIDYQANLNILYEAKRCGVKKFVFVSALNGDKLRHTKIFEAKEKFVDELKQSGLEYLIVRPNGFFSDMKDFINMAKYGRVYLFGKGEKQLNPIHGEDLANVIVDAIYSIKNKEIKIGGPKIYSHKEIAELAFKIIDKKTKITYIPDCCRKLILKVLPIFCNTKRYGPVEFFLSVMDIDMIAPKYGKYDLETFYKNEQNQ